MLVDHYEDDWSKLWWVRLRGTARIVEDPRAVELLPAKYPQYAERPPGRPGDRGRDRGAERVDELAFLTATEQAELVRRGEVTPRELVELYLERIERLDPELNAFVTVCGEAAVAAEPADGPFRGVPSRSRTCRRPRESGRPSPPARSPTTCPTSTSPSSAG